MYKNLKFSWAHILTFVAIVYIGYASFVGLTYMIDDGFIKPLLWTLAIVAFLLLWFVGAQQLKGVDNDFNFARCIWVERILIFLSPIVFVVCMIPLNHAWNVASHSDEIETKFQNSLKSSTKMFDDYESYSRGRISDYKMLLNRVKSNKDIQPTVYAEIGFDGKDDDRKIEIEVATLKRQLTANYDTLSVNARAWIDRANNSTSVWNVFLVGNIKEIKEAIIVWKQQMYDYSSVILTTENYGDSHKVSPFSVDENYIGNTLRDLDSLGNLYKDNNGLSMTALLLGVLIYLMLIVPYIVQNRNGVSVFTLFGQRGQGHGTSIHDSKGDTRTDTPVERIDMDTRQSDSEVNQIWPDEDEDEVDDTYNKRERRRRRREQRLAREGYRHNMENSDEEYQDDEIIAPIKDL